MSESNKCLWQICTCKVARPRKRSNKQLLACTSHNQHHSKIKKEHHNELGTHRESSKTNSPGSHLTKIHRAKVNKGNHYTVGKNKIWRTWKYLEDLECGKKNSPKSEMESKCSSFMVHQIRRGLSKEVKNSWNLAVGVKEKSKQRNI